MSGSIRILLADDHPVMREGLRLVLATQDDLLVAGEAADGAEAVALVRTLRPDVVLMDLEMPGVDGIEAIRRIRAEAPGARVVVFTAYQSDEQVLGAVRAGACGYLLKGAPREELFRAVRAAHAGTSPIEPAIAARLLARLGEGGRVAPAHDTLTARERQVLALVAAGRANKQIAAELGMSERTAKFHVSAIMGKLGAANRTEAVTRAAARGLVTLPDG